MAGARQRRPNVVGSQRGVLCAHGNLDCYGYVVDETASAREAVPQSIGHSLVYKRTQGDRPFLSREHRGAEDWESQGVNECGDLAVVYGAWPSIPRNFDGYVFAYICSMQPTSSFGS